MTEETEEPEPNANDDSAQSDDQDEYLEPVQKFDRAVNYMETEKGHEVTLRIIAMLEHLSPVLKTLLEAKATEHTARPKLEFWKWVLLLIARLLVFTVAVGALIYMRNAGTIDPAIALLIGGLVAYFFGYNKAQS